MPRFSAHCQDPCVLFTLLSVQHFFDIDEVRPWWHFAAQGKVLRHATE